MTNKSVTVMLLVPLPPQQCNEEAADAVTLSKLKTALLILQL